MKHTLLATFAFSFLTLSCSKGEFNKASGQTINPPDKNTNNSPVNDSTGVDAQTEAGRLELIAIGNSITYHDCVPAIGWCNQWGMASPSAEQDYAHLVARGINASKMSTQSIVQAEMDPSNSEEVISDIKRLITPESIIVIELGDNVKTTDLIAFRNIYGKLITAASEGKKVVCTSTYWIRVEIDNVMYEECISRGGKWVFIGDIEPSPLNIDKITKQFDNVGVNSHPQAWGMARIAERILAALDDKQD